MADVGKLSPEKTLEAADNFDMPPPGIPSKLQEKGKTEDEGFKRKSSMKEKKETTPELPYKVPSWSGVPEDLYSLEVLKNGCIISNIDLTSKPFHVFGRLPNCDVSLEHPSVSRYHAVIQYKISDSSNSEKGFYIYDLGSTHGTTVNKSRIEPKRYYRLRVGYVFKFGGSSRLFILQGPEEPEEADTDQAPAQQVAPKSVSEVGRVMTDEEYEEWKKEREGGKEHDKDGGIDWGMGEDALEEPAYPADFGDVDKNQEEHHFKDPKKTLRGFFEREGLELEYDVEEKGPGHARVYHCKVKLPIDGPSGEPLYAEAAVAGKKKDAVLECALEACRMLDASGLLRQSSHESKKHKEKNWEENDFYDSDEDTFLDRTGSVEKKRIQRMKRAGKDQPTLETYESLTVKLRTLDSEIHDCENKLQQDKDAKSGSNFEVSADSLDDYMSSLGTTMDKTSRSQIRRKVFDLKKERQRLVKLLNVAKPASLPQVAESPSIESVFKNDGVVMMTKSETGDSTSTPTVDQNTDSRHESVALMEEIRRDENFSRESSVTSARVCDKNSPEKEQEFAVPGLPSLNRGKNRTSKTISSEEKIVDDKETDKENTKDSAKTDEDKKDERKRVGSSVSVDVQEDLNEKPEENNEGVSPKKKKKRMYSAPTQWQSDSDPTYTAWMPPEGQTGDGRTHLNEKFGY